MEHMIPFLEQFEESPHLYEVRGIPFIVIVNKQGKIKYMGNPSSIKVEEFLQKMLDEGEGNEEKKQEEEKVQKGVITEEKFNQLVAIQKEYLQLILFNSFGLMNGGFVIAKSLTLRMYEKQYNKIKEFGEFVEKIEKIVKKEDFEEEFNLQLEKQITVEFGKECDNCKKVLTPTDKQYYCYFHNIWLCYKCGNKIDETKKGNSKYIHPCNMVYINVINDTGMKNIDEYKFGTNIQFDEDTYIHQFTCNGCSGGGVERYICLTCRPGLMRRGFVDICEPCQTILNERKIESDEYKKVKENVMYEKHDEQTHILLRVLFGKGKYNDEY